MVVMAEVIGGTAILLCILLVIYAISRYFGIHLIENMSLAGRRKYQTPQYSAKAVKNPFSLQVDADSCSSSGVCQDLSQGIVIKVKATVTCEVKCFWVTDLNAALWCHVGNNSVNDLAREPRGPSSKSVVEFLELNSTECSQRKLLNSSVDEDTVLNLKPPCADELSASDNGMLVVTMSLSETTAQSAISNEDIVCLFTVIEAGLPSQARLCRCFVSKQYIQTADQRIFSLETLYASGVPDPQVEVNSYKTTNDNDLCVICHSWPVTRALLPCRHACICGSCFKRTKLCPLCRNVINSFLVTGDESQLPIDPPAEEDINEETSRQLNDMGAIELLRAVWNAS